MNKFNFMRDGASIHLPPGFRFQPTDQEIVFQYLARKIFSCPLPASVIPELDDVFAFHPSTLPGDSERDRYFFASSREVNLRRMGAVGFWKATDLEKRVVCSKRMPIVGIKRTLVYYHGKLPRAVRTDWCMHVYYIALAENNTSCTSIHHYSQSQIGMNRVGKWVLCHVFSKKKSLNSGNSWKQSFDHFMTADEMSDDDEGSCSSSSSSSASDSSAAFSETSSTTVDC